MKESTRELYLKNIIASMQAEGYSVSDETKETCRQILEKRCSADEAVAKCILRYKKK